MIHVPPDLVQRIQAIGPRDGRVVVAVAGPPGSGKSTLAEALAQALGEGAAVLPMDGFHLDNDALVARDLLSRKGAPETFDAAGFVDLIRRVRRDADLSYPTFDRTRDQTVPEGGRLGPETRIVIAEGNYLLLNSAPWCDLHPLFDLTVMLEVARSVLEARLIDRWRHHGLSQADATARARGNDLRNADTVMENSRVADVTIR